MVTTPGGEGQRARPTERLLVCAGVAAAAFALAWLSLAMLGPSRIAPVWPANGVLLAALLRRERREWPAILAAGLIGIAAGGLMNGGAVRSSFGLALCDLLEVGLSATAIRAFGGGAPDLSRLRVVAVGGLAAIASAAVGAVGAGVVLDWLGRGSILSAAVVWTLANALGQMTAAPIVLLLRPPEGRRAISRRKLVWSALSLAALAGTVSLVFQQAHYDLIYLIFAPLLVVVFQLEVLGAAIGILLTAILAVGFTVRGHGPMWLMADDPTERVILLQLFLLGVVATNFPLAAALADGRRGHDAARLGEARYRLLAENSRDIVFEFDAQANIRYASAAVRQLGYEPADLVGHSCFSFVHPDDVATARKAMAVQLDPSLADGVVSQEWRLRTAAGDYVWVEGNPAVSRDAEGRPVGYTDSVRDISRRKVLEADLRRKQAQAEASERARRAAEARARENLDELARVSRVLSVGEFASSIAHELNQPIAAIVTNGDTALRWLGNDPPDLAEARLAVGRSIRDAERAAAIINRTRALLSKHPPAFAEVDIDACVDDVLLFTDLVLRRNHVEVRKHLAARIPPAWGDRVQLQQVLLNLIGNGLDAMVGNEGRPRVLDITTGTDPAGRVVVTVEDNGCGLAPEVAERLFDSFFTTKTDGVGLGLPISRSIVEAHGGRLWATPRKGGGTAFRFTVRASVGQPG
ncbi:MASE1 domain-containing protein [Phenylobacterium sp.]|uniref:MASE1 domain-containing protein n=1 Tax=Phenylobacterium sp. TaxID=1871053 RepID=UPI0025ED6AEB|nr:MASE1 domain-containing protein [Phenylobacterium sp.]